MPDCDYCGESFDDEGELVAHLGAEHEGELGTIDQRRVDQHRGGDEEGGIALGPVILVTLLILAGAVMVYVTWIMGGEGDGVAAAAADLDPAQTPNDEAAHYHGIMNVTIAGERVDFSQNKYQVQDPAFHFENNNGRVWHGHATGVTLEYALSTLGIGVNETAVSFQGTTYSESDPGTEVTVEVDGEPVDPRTYVLQGVADPTGQGGDHVRVVVRTDGAA